jgi:serine/threonine-protein kinase RsbW
MDAGPETLTIASRLECIDDARAWVSERVRAAGFGDEPVSEIELALTEALANVMEHSYAGDTSKEIAVTVVGDEHSLRISVRDWGTSFDPAGYSPRDLDDPGEGGYGVFLIDELMDRVIREAQPDGGTLLTLVKRKEEHHG